MLVRFCAVDKTVRIAVKPCGVEKKIMLSAEEQVGTAQEEEVNVDEKFCDEPRVCL